MRHFRFTIASLIGLVLFAAISAAALRAANDFWDCIVSSLTLGCLLVSVLLAIHRTGPRRAFWIGFALFGGVYLLASLVPSVEARLLTTTALARLDEKMPGRLTTGVSIQGKRWLRVAFSPQGNQLAANQNGTIQLWDATNGRLLAGPGGNTASFLRIGHSLLAVVLGYIGGFLSRYFATSGDRQNAEAELATPPASTPAAPSEKEES